MKADAGNSSFILPPSSFGAAEPAGASWWPWKVCLFLLTATALSYLDRLALPVVAPAVQRELSLDNEQLGRLLSAFLITYAAVHIPVGWILDRFNIRVTYGLFVALWSVAQIGCGLAGSFYGLFTGRLFLGAFETAGQTGAARIIARILPSRDRAFANGIMMSGGSLGAIVAPWLMIWLANQFGWRTGFVVLGAVGLLWAAAWIAWFQPSAEVLYGPRKRSMEPKDRWQAIIRNPQFWSCAGGALFTIPIIHIASSWMPTYLAQEWKLSVGPALSLCLFLIYLGLDVGFMGGGALVRYFISRGHNVAAARKLVMGLSALVMLVAVAVPLAPSLPIVVLLVFLLNVGRASWGALFLAFNQEIAPGRVGTIAGTMGSIGALSGAVLVWLIGVVSKTSGFDTPFFVLGLLVIAGTLPVLWVDWNES
jgi:ACS family hexuronate transporter-like MFS transporter